MLDLRIVWVACLAIGSTSACGSLVGEQCRSPFTQCGHVCVDLSDDPFNCGACGNACARGVTCVDGTCGATHDAAVLDDAARDLDAAVDAAVDATSRDSATDASSTDGAVDAPVIGDANTPDAGDAGPPFSCAPLVDCGGLCVDLQSDPDHCGSCAMSCDSGICVGGMCESILAGHLVVIGHDYESYRGAMSSLLANAVLLPARATVRVLIWEGAASTAAIAGVQSAIAAGAGSRAYTITIATDPSALAALLSTADTFLLLGQTGASDAQLHALGATWSTPLTGFIAGGGVVVALEAPAATNAGTFQVLTTAGLFDATSRTELMLPRLMTVTGRAGDPVLLGVPLSYRGELHTSFFDTADPDVIVSAPSGAVVVDRTVAP